MDYDRIKAMTYEDLAQDIQKCNTPFPSYLQCKWESAKIMHAIGQWKKYNGWMCEAYVTYQEEDPTFWMRQFKEAYQALELSEQPCAQERARSIKATATVQLLIAKTTGRITKEEFGDIMTEGLLLGNESNHWAQWKATLQQLNNLTDEAAIEWLANNRS